MRAKIYQPSRSAMQSGKAKSQIWLLEFFSDSPKYKDPLMGWTGNADTSRQVRLKFATKEEAIAYAEREGLEFVVAEPLKKVKRSKSYSDNFASGRKTVWTH